MISNKNHITDQIRQICLSLTVSTYLPIYSAGIYLFKGNNGNTRTMCHIC